MNQAANHDQPLLPRLLISGIDSLYVSYYLDSFRFDWEELDYQKELLKQDQRQDFAKITLGGEEWALRPTGNFPYRYVLKNEYFQVSIAIKNQPNCYVQFLSHGLWTKGFAWLQNWLLAWFDRLKVQATRPEGISRVDFAFDFYLPIINFKSDNFVSRATKDGLWRENRAEQTFQFGAGQTVLRVYDKVAEIEEKSGKYWFYDLWGQDKNVWRVEFQIRRDRLVKTGIDTLADLERFRGDILRDLAKNHTSLRLPTEDSNRSRWPYHPLWLSLLDAISREPQTGLIETYKPDNSLNYALNHQLRSLYGDFKGLGALISVLHGKREPLSFERLIEFLPNLLQNTHHPITWSNDVKKRMDARRIGK